MISLVDRELRLVEEAACTVRALPLVVVLQFGLVLVVSTPTTNRRDSQSGIVKSFVAAREPFRESLRLAKAPLPMFIERFAFVRW